MKPDQNDYLRLLEFYRDAITGSEATSLRLPLERVFRMLITPSDFNRRLPRTFVETAARYMNHQTDALRHFHDPEVQQFFLSDLYDFIKLDALRQRS